METAHLSVINLLQCAPGFATEKRVEDHPYLLYVHRGAGKFKIASVTYDAGIGDLFFCPAYVGNTIFADENDPFLLSGIDFTAAGLDDLLAQIAPRQNIAQDPFLTMCIQEMVDEYLYGKTCSGPVCDHILHTLLLRIARLSGQRSTDRQDITDALLDYIIRNFSREITHEQLSALFSYHRNSINRILLRATGLTLKEYVIDIRIKKACEFLLYSDKDIREIAELCGYSSSVYFTRQFKQKTGITPSVYRSVLRRGSAAARL